MKSRLVTAAILIVVVLAVVLQQNNVSFVLLSGALVALGVSELSAMLRTELRWPVIATAVWLGLSGLCLVYRLTLLPLIAACVLFVISLWALSSSRLGARWWRLELGSMWIGAPFIAIMVLHEMGRPDHGFWFAPNRTLMTLFPIWAGDSIAIFVGKFFGKHPLAPSISPGKTWEGAVANLTAAMVLAWFTGSWLGLGIPARLICGLVTGIGGQLGDLFESRLKRQIGVKDSSSLLPGHGGYLDRLDSLFFSAPLVAVTLSIFQ